jgi:predicted small integral membrane protein
MRCCGRRVFTTSPVRWAPISTLTSFDSFATDHALFISPSMSMPIRVESEWFLMWQSKMWNGQEEAFRMFAIVGVVFLIVVQRAPTPD